MHEEEKDVLDRNPMSARNYGFDFKPFVGDIELFKRRRKIFYRRRFFEIFHVPGHSPGSIAYNEAQKFVISGDALFQGSIGRTDLYRGNHEQLLESIRTKLLLYQKKQKCIAVTETQHKSVLRKITIRFSKK